MTLLQISANVAVFWTLPEERLYEILEKLCDESTKQNLLEG